MTGKIFHTFILELFNFVLYLKTDYSSGSIFHIKSFRLQTSKLAFGPNFVSYKETDTHCIVTDFAYFSHSLEMIISYLTGY